MSSKRTMFFLSMYKTVDSSAKTCSKAEVTAINIHENDDVNKTVLLSLCISDASKRWVGKNLYDLIDKEIKGKYEVTDMSDLTNQQIRKYKIDRVKLIKGCKYSTYVSKNILIPIIMQSRLSDAKQSNLELI